MTQTAEFPAVAADRWTPVEIVFLGPDDWPVLQAARLEALHDSPYAFVATLAVELERTPEQWRVSIESSTWVAAQHDGETVGIACLARTLEGGRKEWFIESVWVTLRQRRKGLVRRMLQRLEEQARAEGAKLLQLWVLETNYPAYDAYLKLTFDELPDKEQNSTKLHVDGTCLRERLMVKQLL